LPQVKLRGDQLHGRGRVLTQLGVTVQAGFGGDRLAGREAQLQVLVDQLDQQRPPLRLALGPGQVLVDGGPLAAPPGGLEALQDGLEMLPGFAGQAGGARTSRR
jgi:hypothetical protein